MFLMRFEGRTGAIDAATKNKTGSEWRGPMVALCGRVNEMYDIVEVQDMDSREYSALVEEFFRRQGSDLNTYGMWEAYRGLMGGLADADDSEAVAQGVCALEQFRTVKI
ncbi:hypothetical protein CLAFUW4_00391 [Fulvia fulva]|uniref:Uncharacterized protein n=1 Tax=Passalora fulva TaxID=5499 RepID=A0A9Q8L6A4_PASFU|nr:uncharacterized protein CLAFUR5_00391 [Fulvia fulva]KAK4636330.1 hypothetical protein CLAFUR4_00391 [Fulvia fulva]KAK4636600.1 hypothetical protein CLAFUR0_00392 [Fulvia fulva]UJO11576.1 hypothetical protein CLAFUR5_00391 [Fulvia fulva]WPV09688.1 hypothetical protein CLAFUW4_00391 [Fulvia fulva]WPV23846.1 hypothetical protein CLAFUW7_00395 [Fulvia fulva]